MTVVRERDVETTPATHYGELLRSTPGVNTIELSARDIQVSTRTATGRNARTTLALLDGRTMYQDYFGMVLWDLLPVSFDEVKQVEVLRGPGSAIWGANAMTGVINIITKSPREMAGTRGAIGIGSPCVRQAGCRMPAFAAGCGTDSAAPTIHRMPGTVPHRCPTARRCLRTQAPGPISTKRTLASTSKRQTEGDGASTAALLTVAA
jgi:TonB-dependent Receptor Plug Domain